MKKVCSYFVLVFMVAALFPQQASAAEEEFIPCAETGADVTCTDINEMLTESAIEKGIPPEVAKAVAFQESTWKQWTDADQTVPNEKQDRDGKVGIGIMQVTDSGYDENRLRNDIQYNINAGLDILNKKWELGGKTIPTVNDNSRDVIEHWYFAVMAYNGLYQVNSPTKQKDGNRNLDAYQEKVFQLMEDYNNGMLLVDLPVNRDHFVYEGEDEGYRLTFNKWHYQVPGPLTKSRQLYEAGDQVYTVEDTRLRTSPNGSANTMLDRRYTATIKDATIFYDDSDESPGRHWVRYEVKLEDGRTGYVSSGAIEPITSRISGKTRIETAVEISQKGWQDGADTVFLAKAFNFPDALAGGPLAYKHDAPILLTRTDELILATKKEIERLGAEKVIILGSEGAVSKTVENELKSSQLDVERIGGVDRYETAKKIADKLDADHGKAIVATGVNYPDALAVAPFAAKNEIPILLTRTASAPAPTEQALVGKSDVYVIGGDDVVSNAVVQNVSGDVQRVSGPTRFDTAAEIIETFDFGDQQGLVSTGLNYADALTGSVLAAKKNAPLLLVREKSIPISIEAIIEKRDIHHYILLGGDDVVNVDSELSQLASQIKK